jgi:hypothetical protein
VGDEHRYREIFVPDCGALQDIKVFDVNAWDWQSLLHFLSTNYELVYSEDGVVESLPNFATIWQRHNEKALTLKVLLPGFTVNSCFFDDDQIELDLLPEDIDSPEKANAVFALIKAIARLLQKEVFLVEENASATPEELRQMAACSCDPRNAEIRYISPLQES